MNQTITHTSASTSNVRLADSVIRAGTIYTMTADRGVYRAIAIRDGWIVAISADPHGLDGLITDSTRVVDEPGLTLLPAFDDPETLFN